MRNTIVRMLLIGAVTLSLLGCQEDEETVTQEANVPGPGRTAEREGTVQSAPGAPGGTAGTTPEALSQQYVQGAEQIINNLEQKLQAWQQQAGAQAQQDQKVQQLSQQVQQELADAKAAVEKMRTATGTQMKDAKVAADQAIKDAEDAFMQLQSATSGQREVTQVQ